MIKSERKKEIDMRHLEHEIISLIESGAAKKNHTASRMVNIPLKMKKGLPETDSPFLTNP